MFDLHYDLFEYFILYFLFPFLPPPKKNLTTVISSSTQILVCTQYFKLFPPIFLIFFFCFFGHLSCSVSPSHQSLYCHSHTKTPFSILLAFLSDHFDITLFISFSKRKVNTFTDGTMIQD